MIKAPVLTFLGTLLTAVMVGQSSDTWTFEVAPKVSKVEWSINKMSGSHHGRVDLESGKVNVIDGSLAGGTFIVDMTTIECRDLGEPYKARLEHHLRSREFFAVDSIPRAELVITNVEHLDDQKVDALVTGDLTIKGITHPIRFPVKYKVNEHKFAAFGVLNVDRTLYEVRYGSNRFFENLGDRAVSDVFTLEISIGGKR